MHVHAPVNPQQTLRDGPGPCLRLALAPDEEMPWENIILHMLLAELSFLRSGTMQTLSQGMEAPDWKEQPGKPALTSQAWGRASWVD